MTDDRSSAAAHYERLLAEHYTWMLGDYGQAVEAQGALLAQLGIPPASANARALDLGAGSGIQARALAALGYAVTAVDSSEALLRELAAHAEDAAIATARGDIRDLKSLAVVTAAKRAGGFAVVVCMGDTLTHLDSADEVAQLFVDVHDALAPGGEFVITYRDLTPELTGLGRFIPVRSDADRVMTCFLEFDSARPETVHVHDLVYVRDGERWSLRTSSYRKLRLAADWVVCQLTRVGFSISYCGSAGRLTGIVAKRRSDPLTPYSSTAPHSP